MADNLENNIYEIPFPAEWTGVSVKGVVLEILALDALRIVDAFGKQESLSDIQVDVLRQCSRELTMVMSQIEGDIQAYFLNVAVMVRDVLTKIR